MPDSCSLAYENDFLEEEIRQLICEKGQNSYRIIFTIFDDSVQSLFGRNIAQKPMIDESDEK